MYEVVAVHFTNDCKMNCPFCYREHGTETMGRDIFLGLPRYLKDITNQVALGGGEPTLHPKLVEDFARECKNYDLICNMTTSGHEMKKWDYKKIGELCENLEMVSVSLDDYKRREWNGGQELMRTCMNIKEHTRLGCNLLVDKTMMEDSYLLKLTKSLFDGDFDMVFALYPKNMPRVDILPKRHYYNFLTREYPHFFVDDLTYKILKEKRYENWEEPCHYGQDIISIDELGRVAGCSFSKDYKLQIKEPKDVLKIKDIQFDKKYSCPFLGR